MSEIRIPRVYLNYHYTLRETYIDKYIPLFCSYSTSISPILLYQFKVSNDNVIVTKTNTFLNCFIGIHNDRVRVTLQKFRKLVNTYSSPTTRYNYYCFYGTIMAVEEITGIQEILACICIKSDVKINEYSSKVDSKDCVLLTTKNLTRNQDYRYIYRNLKRFLDKKKPEGLDVVEVDSIEDECFKSSLVLPKFKTIMDMMEEVNFGNTYFYKQWLIEEEKRKERERINIERYEQFMKVEEEARRIRAERAQAEQAIRLADAAAREERRRRNNRVVELVDDTEDVPLDVEDRSLGEFIRLDIDSIPQSMVDYSEMPSRATTDIYNGVRDFSPSGGINNTFSYTTTGNTTTVAVPNSITYAIDGRNYTINPGEYIVGIDPYRRETEEEQEPF